MTDFKHKKISFTNEEKIKRIQARQNLAGKKVIKRKIIRKKKNPQKSSFLGKFIKFFLLFTLLFIILGVIAGGSYIYFKYWKNLQPIENIEKVVLAESSVIYDKNGNELYTLFDKENRTYAKYSQISKNMINAIVAGEDKTFFTNPGIDIKGILRAIYVSLKTGHSPGGTSTISQQLIKNMLLSNERKIDRKIKEALLSYKLNKKYSKQEILELYLNKISFGGNTSGIQQASKNFFGIDAKDLNILQSAYLASQPKSPTAFSPYSHYGRLNGYLYIFNKLKKNIDPKSGDFEGLKLIFDEDIKRNKKNIDKFKNFINNLTAKKIDEDTLQICGLKKENLKNIINIDTSGCSIIEYSKLLNFLNNLKFDLDNDLVMEYQTGRKDYILTRMLADNYISFDDFKKALIDSIGFKFKKSTIHIKYPHFVFYVKEYLEKKYGKEFLKKGGFKIYTTLDPEIQDKAQKIVENGVAKNSKKYGARNASLISVENKTGRILAYIGGVDYYDKKNGGNVDILTSKLQPGSTFKPLVYSLAIDSRAIGDGTPIYDVKTNFGSKYRKYEPNNFDGRFMGRLTVAKALNHSRNIPAIKMYFMAGGTEKIVEYLDKLGIHTLNKNGDYGPSLGLGTGLVKPLELAQVYSVFANMGEKVDISPIEKIIDSNGILIEQREKEAKKKKEVLDKRVAYIMNYILSNKTGKRPASWNKFMMLKGRVMAAKTGTSTDVSKKKGKKVHPKNLWTIGYTPKVTTVVWAGNTNGKALYLNASGLEGAGPIMHSFMDYITKKNPAGDWKKPEKLRKIAISGISGLLAAKSTPKSLVNYSYFKNPPKKWDTSYKVINIDSRCNGKVTELTPQEFIKPAYIVNFTSIDPKRESWNRPVRAWGRSTGLLKGGVITNPGALKECENDLEKLKKSNAKVILQLANSTGILVSGNNTIKIGYKSELPILRFDVYLSGIKIKSISYFSNRKFGVITDKIFIPEKFSGNQTLKVVGVDEVFKKYPDSKEVIIKNEDNIPPKITLVNPANGVKKIYQNTFFNLRFKVFDETAVRSSNVYLDGKKIAIGLQGNNIVVPINKNNDISVGNHIITIKAVDDKFNESSQKVALVIMPPNGPLKKDNNTTKDGNKTQEKEKANSSSNTKPKESKTSDTKKDLAPKKENTKKEVKTSSGNTNDVFIH